MTVGPQLTISRLFYAGLSFFILHISYAVPKEQALYQNVNCTAWLHFNPTTSTHSDTQIYTYTTQSHYDMEVWAILLYKAPDFPWMVIHHTVLRPLSRGCMRNMQLKEN